ncbi:uncharacterized protein E5676_scaffold104G00900 [Cucumis melo var. makuwa]|uniref:Uncharacterized protein n=1 Tax=Cucumis melo var. makuwa TaxID=1194695 RepID=A0A5A7SWI9_CUCMM|nr:uncharacterized protein E6C27_scaffold261G00730 [Cucumis melo var. makuwa]TYJ95659.1 uncharacterized protein E5676_scaffold104G00900 [Cucumis melo var. makuwa]
MYEYRLNIFINSNWDSLKGVERHLLTIGMCPSYTEWVYHGEPVNLYRGIGRFDEGTNTDPFHEGTSNNSFHIEGTSSNMFYEDNEMLRMLHSLQSPIEYEEETTEEVDLENDIPFNSGVEKDMKNIFEELLNQACREFIDLAYCPTCGKSQYKASPIRGKRNPSQDIATLSIDTEITTIVCIAKGLMKNEMTLG